MSPIEAPTIEPVSRERLAEASVWIAKLHGDARGRAIEDGLRRWLQAHPENARAFELATEVWDDSEQLRSVVPFRPLRHVEHRRRWGAMAAALACMLALVIVGIFWLQNVGVVATAVGEQRQLVLEDGTRVFLNTDTRIVVKYDERARRVELRRGEALFNVAKRHDWPFIVTVGDRQVKALGTSFVVRRDVERLAVTLVEGSVLVSPVLPVLPEQIQPTIDAPGAIEQTPAAALDTRSAGEFKLAAGQRLTFDTGSVTKLDTPSIEKTTAWRRGQVILDDTPLQAAVIEMNRYSEARLIVADPDTAALPINGLFQAGDSTHFANAVAQAYGLVVIERGNEIVLSGKPVQ